jgi:adenylylsulfate kinase
VLDGDNVRHGLNYNLGFSMEDRKENVRRVAEVAKLMNDAGLVVITSFISPLKTDREIAKLIIGENKFREIYVSTPLEVCESRDPKGLYLKAREGLVTEFTGISSPYEAPENPWLSIDTSLIKVDEAIAELMSVIPY